MIKAIIFDFGGVLHRYNQNNFTRMLAKQLKVSPLRLETTFTRQVPAFELAKISEETFWKRITKEVGTSAEVSKLHAMTLSYLQPNLRIYELVKKLKKKKYRIAMITNNVSWIYELDKKYHFRKLFNPFISSNEVKLRKPNPKIFKLALKKLGLEPEETVFIDDTKSYGPVVEKLGMNFIHFTTPAKLKQELKKLGVNTSP